MLNLLWIILSLFLIIIIFLRAPQNSGLASFATKSNLLGSPSSAERTLNNLTLIAIAAYLLVAIELNFNNFFFILNGTDETRTRNFRRDRAVL
jgi:protein translocase SecG subunit